ncbi:MAG: MFS transporter [Sphingomonas sp.]|nr:MFS transporter [Sphingomonas sp.]
MGARGLTVLLAAAFVVALAYGIALPLYPLLIGRAFGEGADLGLHTGLLAGAYALALFLVAPLWGRWSDRGGRRLVLLVGLGGFALAMVVGALFPGPLGLYLSRFLAGAFAASVMPVAQALVADLAVDHDVRARQIAWLGMAAIAGLLAGPLVGGAAGAVVRPGLGALAIVQGGVALAAVLTAAIALLWLRSTAARGGRRAPARPPQPRPLAILILLSALVAAGLGAFEVGVTVRGRFDPSLTSSELGGLFAECMLVMAAAQALVFNRWVRARSTYRLVVPGLLALGLGLFLLPWAGSGMGLMLATAAIAAASGVLLPVLAFWVTLAAGPTQGRALGRQSSWSSLGQAAGSTLAGLLAATPAPLNGGLLLTGAAAVTAAILLLPALPRLLRPIGA